MHPYKHITILAQTENAHYSGNGIHADGQAVVGINRELGLLVVALNHGQNDGQGAAYKSVEILLDDMAFNFAVTGNSRKSSSATQCLQQSLDNINEFLCVPVSSDNVLANRTGVDLTAIQIHQNSLSCSSLGALCCYIFNADSLQNLAKNETPQTQLGIDGSSQADISELGVSQGDIMLITTPLVMQYMNLEFVRVTLSRFSDNLEMAIRQINTRTTRSGLTKKPLFILCRIEQAGEIQRSWLDKLRKR